MQLTSFIVYGKYVLKIGTIMLFISNNNLVIAEPLTYSPDQWPRHWNVLMNKINLKGQINGHRVNGRYAIQAPLRSQLWGVVPKAKQKPRRSLRPEYDTNSHMRNYYSGYRGYTFPVTYGTPMISPYGASVIGPGLAAPGIPFGTYPFLTPSPFMRSYPVMGGMPGLGYMW